MSMFDDLAAQYTALPSWAQIGIPVAGLGGIAYIALHKGSSTSVVSGPGVSAGAGNGGGSAGSANYVPISSSPGGGGTAISQPGPSAPEPVTQPSPTVSYATPTPTATTSTIPVNPYAQAPQTTVNPYGATAESIAQITANNPYHANSAAISSAAAQSVSGHPYMSNIPTWGSPQNLSAPSGDTYVLAQQEYYALTHPSAIPAGSVFASMAGQNVSLAGGQVSGLQFNLGQLLGNIEGGGAAYYGGYPAIPNSVLQSGGFVEQQAFTGAKAANIAAGTYIPLTTATTYQGGATPASSPGPTNYAAANATLYRYIQTYEAVANPTAAQRAALATDIATYQRQGGVL